MNNNMNLTYSVVVCTDVLGGIAKDGKIPWNSSKDMVFFRKLTISTFNPCSRNAIIMGMNTWNTINFPLNSRLNIVITRKNIPKNSIPNVITCNSFEDSLEYIKNRKSEHNDIEKIFVIGGYQIYKIALSYENCESIYKTELKENYNCDLFFPNIDHNYNFIKTVLKKEEDLTFYCYRKTHNFEEEQYLSLVKNIINTGNKKSDRTNIGTLSLFGKKMVFNLQYTFPLLTTKKVFWKGVCEELLWFISGSPNSNELKEKGVNIWEKNTSREFLDSRGLHFYEKGSIGKGYGFQWRHYGAEYTTMNDNYEGKGYDQLKNAINLIKTDPNSRKIIINSWNPVDLHLMALEPCHILCQFYVYNNELSCCMYQRSCDMGLGVPFNIASYSLLTCMIAKICDLTPGNFIYMMGECHVYNTHIDALKEQITRKPKTFPKLTLDKVDSIDDFKMEHIHLNNYIHHPHIKMELSV